MQNIINCCLLLLLVSCSGGSGGDESGIEIYPQAQEVAVTEKEIPVQAFEYIDFDSIHQLKIISDEHSVFEQNNFVANQSLLYEEVLKNYIVYEDFSFLKGIHHHLIRQFGEAERKTRYPGESCTIKVNVRFSVPGAFKNKVLTDSMKMNFVIQLSNNKDVVIPAEFASEKTILDNKAEYTIRSVNNLDKNDCHSMLSRRGRLTLEIESLKLGDGQDYFVGLEEQLRGRKLYGVLEQDKESYFSVPDDISEERLQDENLLPLVDEGNWYVLYDQAAKLFFKATIDQLERSDLRWKRAHGKIDRPREMNFESPVHELVIYLHGYKNDPQVKKVQGVEMKQGPGQFPLVVDYSEIVSAPTICHLFYKKIEMKSKLISSLDGWKQLPLEIDTEGGKGSLWNYPGLQYKMIGETLALYFAQGILSRYDVSINFYTTLGHKRVNITPDYQRNAPERCQKDFNVEDKVIKTVNITSEYSYELYYR